MPCVSDAMRLSRGRRSRHGCGVAIRVARIGHTALPILHRLVSAIERLHSMRELSVIQFRNVSERRQIAEPIAPESDSEHSAAKIEVGDTPGNGDKPVVVIDDGVLDATAVAHDEITHPSKASAVLEHHRCADDRAALEVLATGGDVACRTRISVPIAGWSRIASCTNAGPHRPDLKSDTSRAGLQIDLAERLNGGNQHASRQSQIDISVT